MEEKPEAMQGFFGRGPGMGSGPDAYQDPFGRRFPLPFLPFFPIFVFRIPPRRFIFVPIPRRRRRRFDVDAADMDCDMCIHCISDAEWDCMMRLGIPECNVAMDR
ncbi:MAG: hypothetical protein ACOX5M_09165 [Bacillota bacterium]